jgi:hypothetical protein
LGNGIEWAQARYQTAKGATPLFCPPDKIGLGVENYIDVINVGIAANKATMSNAAMDDTPIGIWLLQGFITTFPCK